MVQPQGASEGVCIPYRDRHVPLSSSVELSSMPKTPVDSLLSMWPVTMAPRKPHAYCSARKPLSQLQIKW